MKAIIEIELEVAGEYNPETDNELIVDAILDSLDSMWFIGEDEHGDSRLDVISKSASCTIPLHNHLKLISVFTLRFISLDKSIT